MKNILYLTTIICFLFSSQLSFSQEWKDLKVYEATTGKKSLDEGNWLTKDRIKNTDVWNRSNHYNLTLADGNLKYQTISEIRDFYIWFDAERKKLGHEVITFGVAAIVAGQLSNFDKKFIRKHIVKNEDVIYFGNEGSKRVLAYFYPAIKVLYFSNNILKGEKAKAWDTDIAKYEQCKIVEPIYKELPDEAIVKLDRMAKGMGVFKLKVKKELRYEGDIKDCEARYTHSFTKLYTFYLAQESKNSIVDK